MTRRILLIAVIGLVLAAGLYFLVFRSEEPTAPQTASGSAQPPPEVGIVVAHPAEVPYPEEFAGRIAGFRDVEVRPRSQTRSLRLLPVRPPESSTVSAA